MQITGAHLFRINRVVKVIQIVHEAWYTYFQAAKNKLSNKRLNTQVRHKFSLCHVFRKVLQSILQKSNTVFGLNLDVVLFDAHHHIS